tara:strand:+ start:385 stop:705 length:321 start_codon:yes stop_codon:yes gene_type:complete
MFIDLTMGFFLGVLTVIFIQMMAGWWLAASDMASDNDEEEEDLGWTGEDTLPVHVLWCKDDKNGLQIPEEESNWEIIHISREEVIKVLEDIKEGRDESWILRPPIR